MIDLNYKVAILGLGREGLDLLRFLNNLKVKPVGLDNKLPKAFDLAALSKIKQLTSRLYLGNDYLDHFNEFDLVFKSPGIALALPEIKQARRRGVIFSSLTQLFFSLCPAKIIGITGTKGKSTTASLIYHLLKHKLANGKVYFGGNIGLPPLKFLSKLTKQDIIILELSSFQLEDLYHSPHIAVVLNIVPEHLDRHGTFKKYLNAKSNIFLHQTSKDYLIFSDDYPILRRMLKTSKGKAFKYSVRKILARGVYLIDDTIVARNIKTGRRQVIMPKIEVPLLGEHNLQNVLAAIAVALLCKISPTQIRQKIKTFSTLPHRLELVGSFRKVNFINDSMATTPVATLSAVSAISGDIALILGGVSKGEVIKQLIIKLKLPKIKGLVLIGESAERLSSAIDTYAKKIPYVKTTTLESAVKKAYQYIKKDGGTLLLAPAFASFDMFKDAYDRGTQFTTVVELFIKQQQNQ